MNEGSRSTWQLLKDPKFGPFFAGRVVSASGMWIQNITAALVMWELTGSALMVGLVSAAQFLGPLLLGFWTGLLTDLVDRRIILLLGRVLSGAVALALCAMDLLLPGGLTPGALTIAVLVLGLGYALSSPAMHALVPSLVPQEDLDAAVALNSVVGSLARAVGPAIGAGLLLLGGAALSFAVAALAHFSFAGALLVIRAEPYDKPHSKRVLDGLRFVLADRTTLSLLTAVTALSFGVDSVITLTPSVASSINAIGASVGLLASGFGAGAVLGAALLRGLRARMTLRRVSLIGFASQALGLLVVAFAGTLYLATIGFAMAGCGFLWATTALNTRIQRHVPGGLRGRVMALWTVAFLGFRPVAAIVNGTITDLVSLEAALMVGAAVSLSAIGLSQARYSQS